LSKNVALFIDVANIYYAARGQNVDVDYIALLKHATKGRDLIRAYAYSGLDPENENQRKFLDFLSKNDYKVVHKDIRKFGDGRVKANLDIELVVDLFRLQDRMDIAVIVSGDGDFASAIRALQDVGVRCEVISFRPNTSSDLIAVADEFTDIMKITGIGRGKGSRTMSMPEMPAKEVNPEFGFREASRGVAAAAIAALREGEKPARGTRRRSSRATEQPRAEAEPEESAAAAPAVEPTTETGDEAEVSRRRRRRRGGRGRGRGRRGSEQTAIENGESGETGETGETGEIGWQEFDDVSELTDLGEPGEERGYAFEEADAETLAALGLVPDQAAASASEGAAEPAERASDAPGAKRRGTRSRRGGKSTQQAETAVPEEPATPGEATGADAGGPAKPPRRRGRTATKAETSGDAPGDASEEPAAEAAKPARRTRARKAAPAEAGPAAGEEERPASAAGRSRSTRSRRTKAADGGTTAQASPTGDGAGESSSPADGDEGIWQRFRSARGGTRRTR
jgi:uncharacterized LabA/DUF88 family protein